MAHKFAYHPNNTPIINNYEDAYYYIVKGSVFSLAEAAAIHLFHIDLRKTIELYEFNHNCKMTRVDIDTYIGHSFGAVQLDNYMRDAAEKLEQTREIIVRKHSRGMWLPIGGVWSGLLGNIATIVVIVGLYKFLHLVEEYSTLNPIADLQYWLSK